MTEILDLIKIGTFVVALFTFIAGVVQFLVTRGRELAWKRTEFVFAQCNYVDNDAELKQVVDILAERSTLTIDHVLTGQGLTEAERWGLTRSLEKFLGLLDRLAYAVDYGRSLTLAEIAEFGWHFRIASSTPSVRALCATSYPCLLAVAPRLQAFIDATWPAQEAGARSPPPSLWPSRIPAH